MRTITCLLFFLLIYSFAGAQQTIEKSGDSVLLTGPGNYTELILQNHTSATPGFLYNTGKGRTAFKKVLQKITDSSYLLGADELKMPWLSLAGNDSVKGSKTFMPTLSASAGEAYGNTFSATLSPVNAGDTLSGVDFTAAIPSATGTVYGIYEAEFREKVLLDSGASSYHSLVQLDTAVNTSTFIRSVATAPFYIYKPSGSNVPAELLVIKPAAAMTSTGTKLTSSTTLADSVYFTGGVQDYSFVKASPVLLQSGGAGGSLRGIYLNGALTGVSNFRGVEINMNSTGGNALYASGTAPSRFAGLLQYAANYAGTYAAQTLVDKHYIDSSATVAAANAAADTSGINFTGKVFIGTTAVTDPAVVMAVNGTLLTQRIRVQVAGDAWPDYVFGKKYTLSTLASTETYIRQNGHLPGVAAAAEVEKSGVDIGATQALLLKKIEELTLHIIQHEQALQKHQQLLKKLAD